MTPSNFLLSTVLRELEDTMPYQQGVLDVLRLLGLIRLENGKGEATGEVAQMVLALLASQADSGGVIGFDWNDLDRTGLRGVDVLRTLQAAQGSIVPTRSVCVAQAVIKAVRGNVEYYLMQFDAHAGQYQPIGGKVDSTDKDSAGALCREIGEEMELGALPVEEFCKLNLLISDWTAAKISPTYGVMTEYTFDFYHVTDIKFPIQQNGYTRWLRRGEIERGRADDSRPVSTVYLEALGMEQLDALEAGAEM